jgi:ABC-type proline/glycine betaine transport system substrate-binding protein
MMEIWWANIEEWWNAEREAGTIVGLDPIFESSAQGYYVPRYVIEGDEARGIDPMAPDLVSVLDLPEYKELFADPEDPDMGVIVSCITGWNCAEVNRIKFYAYGLGETYNISEPGSAGALDAAIAGPYKKGEAVVSYYWEPTWLLGVYDMVMLEEPEYSDECWTQITEISETGVIDESLIGNVPEEAGCAFENYAIPKAVSDDFAASEPELTEFLNTMFIGTENLNKISAYMTQNEAEAEDAAIWYFQNYEDQWREWMPEDVAENVAEAVAAAE